MPDSGQSCERRRPWVAWGCYLVAFVCLLAYGWQWYQRRHYEQQATVTGNVQGDYTEVDRIPLERGVAEGMNVIVLTLDTARADHLHCYGNRGIKTPFIDTLAANGVLFANAFTPSSSTLPGHASIFTGLYPYRHGVRANGTYRLESDQTALAEVLKGHGYATGAFIAAYVLDGRFGLDQGFDYYDDNLRKGIQYSDHSFRERPAQYINESAVEWIKSVADGKFFAWLHYFDPHAPYIPPEPFRTQYAQSPYDGELAYVDFEIGRLLNELGKLNLLDRTVIVLAGDHGEGLGEHGEQTHSLLIYDATLHTPLIFSLPQTRGAKNVCYRQVSNVDIVPTILDLLGLDALPELDGVSLCQGPEAHPDSIYIETISPRTLHGWCPLFGVRTQDAKYIHAPTEEYYDLRKDPRELENLFEERKEKAESLAGVLRGHIGDDLFGEMAVKQMTAMDPETKRMLESLGYVESAAGAARDGPLPDPKDMVPHWDRIQKAEHEMAAGNFQRAVDEWEACLEIVPDDVWTLRLLTTAYLQKGSVDKAEACAKRAFALEQNEPGIYIMLGRIERLRGRAAEAETLFRQALALDPQYATAYVALGQVYDQLGRPEQAAAFFNKAIEMDPGTAGPTAYNALGYMRFARGDVDAAREAFQEALEIDALNGDAHSGLATILIEEEKLEEAERELELARRYLPNNLRVLATLAGLYNKRGDFEKGMDYARRVLAINGKNMQALNNLGNALRQTGDLAGAQDAFEKALGQYSDFVPCILNLAQVYLAQHQEERAAELCRRVLAIQPKQPQALFNLGTYKANHDRAEEALELYRAAVEVDPEYAIAHRHLGMLLWLKGRPEEGLVHLERSLELEPDQPDHERLEGLIEGHRSGDVRPLPASQPSSQPTEQLGAPVPAPDLERHEP